MRDYILFLNVMNLYELDNRNHAWRELEAARNNIRFVDILVPELNNSRQTTTTYVALLEQKLHQYGEYIQVPSAPKIFDVSKLVCNSYHYLVPLYQYPATIATLSKIDSCPICHRCCPFPELSPCQHSLSLRQNIVREYNKQPFITEHKFALNWLHMIYHIIIK